MSAKSSINLQLDYTDPSFRAGLLNRVLDFPDADVAVVSSKAATLGTNGFTATFFPAVIDGSSDPLKTPLGTTAHLAKLYLIGVNIRRSDEATVPSGTATITFDELPSDTSTNETILVVNDAYQVIIAGKGGIEAVEASTLSVVFSATNAGLTADVCLIGKSTA